MSRRRMDSLLMIGLSATLAVLCACGQSADNRGDSSSDAPKDGSTDRVIAVYCAQKDDPTMQLHMDALHLMKHDFELTDEQFYEYFDTEYDSLQTEDLPEGCDLVFFPDEAATDSIAAISQAFPDVELCFFYDDTNGHPDAAPGENHVHYYTMTCADPDDELTSEDLSTYYKYAVKCIANDIDIHIEWRMEVEP